MSTLGKRLAKARKSQKMTQNSLAERMNVARTTISNWENGRSQPDLDALRMLSEIFHCDFLANAPQQHENACMDVVQQLAECVALLVGAKKAICPMWHTIEIKYVLNSI